IAVRSAGREIARITAARAGQSAASTLRLLASLVGYALLLFGVLGLTNVNLGGLLVGGAVTGVVLGVAAQQALGNFFTGLVLLFARPYAPGQRIIVRSGALGGPLEGTIVDAGLIFTTLLTAEGPLHLPNAGLLGSAIGPAPPAAADPPVTPPAAEH
ncbi:MAG: mechanosensitive ion channel, partial [Actinobacteria bacterium]|nr:mechanosensitive ion channel [Actinomycetota bacterium]